MTHSPPTQNHRLVLSTRSQFTVPPRDWRYSYTAGLGTVTHLFILPQQVRQGLSSSGSLKHSVVHPRNVRRPPTQTTNGQIRNLPLRVTHPWRCQVPFRDYGPVQNKFLKPGQVLAGALTVAPVLVVWGTRSPTWATLVRML